MIGRIPVLDVQPLIDCGRHPVKAVPGETFLVSATVFREGPDALGANVVLRDSTGRYGPWTPMRELAPGTDRWGAEITPDSEGRWTYAVEAWADPIATWRHNAKIRIPAGIDTEVTLEEGAVLHERAAAQVPRSAGREEVLARRGGAALSVARCRGAARSGPHATGAGRPGGLSAAGARHGDPSASAPSGA